MNEMKNIVLLLIMSLFGLYGFSQTGSNQYMDNAQYLFGKNNTGTSTRLMGINAGNTLYLGSIDAEVSNLFVNLNGQNRMAVDGSNGNVGISTTTPDGKLHIHGANGNSTNLLLSANYESNHRWRLKTIDRGYAIDLDFTSSDSGDNEETVLKLSRSNSTRPEFQLHGNALVANNGNIGIGTETPSKRLEVVGDIQGDRILLNDPNNTSDWDTVWQSGFFQSYNAASAPEPGQWFWGVNLNHSANNATNRYNGQLLIKNSSTKPTLYFRSTNKDGIGTWARVLHNQGSQFINGALGIGTTNLRSDQLAVNGNIRAKEVKVEATNWPDYVFQEGYDLPTLKEIQAYIQEKGHLPNIPSAAEVEAEGVELGAMNIKLLEKIEELTLHLIQQHQENQKLKEDLALLKKNQQIILNQINK